MIKKSLILTVAGCLGVGATGVLAFKAGENYTKLKDDKDSEEVISKKELIKIFAPAVTVGALTIGCIAGSHYISAKEIAGLSAAVGISFKKYRELVEEFKKKHPEEYEAIKKDIDERHADEAIKKAKTENPHEGKICYYSPWADQVFFATPYDILQAELAINEMLANQFEATLYDYFASFPKECDIQLKEWMKFVGWFNGDTSYTYNAGYFGSYVKTYEEEHPEKGYTVVDFNMFPDYSPELDEMEIACIESAINNGDDI